MTPSIETIRLLTERSGWVRELARSLVRDAATADDVAQDVAVEAIRSADAARRLGPGWLAGVVRNVAARTRKRQRCRERHESAAARGADDAALAPSALDAAAFVEQQRLLAEAVLGLEPPFREVVLLRFYESKPQREIARALGIPVATVNSRLTRGLAKLRARLDREHDGDRSVWVAALAPIVWGSPKVGVVAFGGALVVSKKWIVAACVLFGVMFGGGWLALRSSDRDSESFGSVANTQVATSTNVVAQPANVDSGQPAVEREPVLDVAPRARAQGPSVQIVDALTGEPVPEAEVRSVGPDRYADPGEVGDPFERAFVHGTPLRPDDEARVPRPGLGVSLYARAGRRVGRLSPMGVSGGERNPHRLELWPQHTVRVAVLDARRRPLAAVPITLAMRYPGMAHSMPYAIALSDEAGVAELHWYRSLLRDTPMGRAQLEVALGFVGGERVSQVVEAEVDGRQDVTLICPEVGSARVSVTQRGEPIDDGVQVFLGPFAEAADMLMMRLAARTENGVAEFWPVAAGVPLRAGASLQPGTQMFTSRSPAVTAAGALASLAIDVTARTVRVHGRLLDADGVPHADLRGSCSLQARAGRQPGRAQGIVFATEFATDHDGRFVHAAIVDEHATEFSMQISLPHRVDGPRLEFALEVGATHHDVGDIVLRRLTPLASGRVVDADAAPVLNAMVILVRRSDLEPDGWQAVRTQFGVTGLDGRFEVHGEAPTETDLWITAKVEGRLRHEPVPWQPGAAELELVMAPPTSLIGQIVAPQTIPFDQLQVVVWDEARGVAADVTRPPTAMRDVAIDGSFEVAGMRLGNYTLELRLRCGWQLATIEGVRITGQDSADARLSPFDLGASVGVLDVHVTHESGPVLDATVFATDAAGRTWALGSTARALLVPTGAHSVHVGREGFFAQPIPAIAGRHEVTLSAGLGVDVTVLGIASLPEGYELRVRVASVDDPSAAADTPLDPSMASVNPRNGTAQPRVPGVGDYEIRLRLTDMRTGKTCELEAHPPTHVSVIGRGTKARVSLDAAVLMAARERLAR